MAQDPIKSALKAIKSLKIQGASQVQKAAVNALKKSVLKSRAKTVSEFRKEIEKNGKILAAARPTEPETRTAVAVIVKASQAELPLRELKKNVLKECSSFDARRAEALKKISLNGARILKKKSVVFTHCHSHTVEAVLTEAWKRGKLSKVIATETRPKMQGRITAENLSKKGIPVTLIVDSAAYSFMKDADVFISGADAVLHDGSVVNKIGTAQISFIAKKFNVPHFVATSSHKASIESLMGEKEKIEQRPAEEIWGKKMRNLKIENPAFDTTPAGLIKGIITELGIFSTKKFVEKIGKEFRR